MTPFKIYSPETAHSPADELLAGIRSTLGFVPNVFGTAAESTPALQAFMELNGRFAESSFDATGRELIQIAASMENQCGYCVAGHTAFAQMQAVPSEVIDAVRNNRPIDDHKLEALNRFTRAVVRERGMLRQQDLKRFLDNGYSRAHVLEVILGVCIKTFSNLASNVIGIPLDDAFVGHAWSPETPHTRQRVRAVN
ncbi:MAG: carboxymuconolactone decarboxylase family protein [Denitromonas halophila]|nr:MAG: carboxymuconolactone decarboxylase family protein [Denitromonas halophila]